MAWSFGFLLTIAQSGNQMRLLNTAALPGICKKPVNLFFEVSKCEQTREGGRL